MKTLYIYIIKADGETPCTTADFPTLTSDDITLFYQPPADEDSPAVVRFHREDVQAQYTNKRKVSTVLAVTEEVLLGQFEVIEATVPNARIWNTIYNFDEGLAVKTIMERYYATFTDENTVRVNCDQLLRKFNEGGEFFGRIALENGNLAPPGAHIYTLPVPPDPWTAEDEGGILALIDQIIPAIKYEGFKPEHSRKLFISKKPSREAIARDLVMVFSAYSHIGNNIGKLNKRRVDLVISEKLMKSVETMGVVKQNKTKDGLTLPRLAIAFMPEYLVFRKYLGGELQNQTESKVAVEFKDIVFYGCPEIRSRTEYESFHMEFSSYIFKKEEDTDVDDKVFVKKYKQWNKVSTQGYKSDSAIHGRMADAINATGWNKKKAFQFILDGINAYA